MQFENREALINYEKERDEYYKNWFKTSNKNLFEFYKLMFLETFHPKYRELKKKYENYDGGWYRKNNKIFTHYLFSIDTKDLNDGDICFELESDYDENNIQSAYLCYGNMLMQIK